MAKDKPGIITGFRDFILRGNVVDLAVAVVIGAAFGAVVTAFATDFIGSLIAATIGTADIGSFGPTVNGTVIQLGTTITALINFVIVAAVVYFLVVLPIGRLLAVRKAGREPESVAPAEDVLLLQEIRDLLRDGARPGSVPGTPTT